MSNHSNRVYYDAKGRAHRRGPLNSSERHHHHHRHHRSTAQKVLLVILYVLIALAAIVLVTWRVLDARGKTRLYRQTAEETPMLAEIETEEQAGAEQEALEKAEEWRSGWVRYNGSVYEYNSDILTFLIMDGGRREKEGLEPLLSYVRRVRETKTVEELSALCREEGFLFGAPYAQ